MQTFLRYPCIADSVPREFPRFRVQFDVVRTWRTQQLTRHEQAHFVQLLVPALANRVGKRVVVARDKIIRPISRKKFCGFRFFTADARACFGRNVMKNPSTASRFACNGGTSIEPDGFLLPPTPERYGVGRILRHPQRGIPACRRPWPRLDTETIRRTWLEPSQEGDRDCREAGMMDAGVELCLSRAGVPWSYTKDFPELHRE
jgi:hypothetical protein